MIYPISSYCRLSSKKSLNFDFYLQTNSTNVYPKPSPTVISYIKNPIHIYSCKYPPPLQPAQPPASHTSYVLPNPICPIYL